MNRLHEELESCAEASLEAENKKVQQQLNAQEALAAIEAELDAARVQLVRSGGKKQDGRFSILLKKQGCTR